MAKMSSNINISALPNYETMGSYIYVSKTVSKEKILGHFDIVRSIDLRSTALQRLSFDLR